MAASGLWLVAYDIREPRRLSRLHRYIAGQACMVQYSVYLFEGSSRGLKALLQELRQYMAEDADDIRAYSIPEAAQLDILGRRTGIDGITLVSDAPTLQRLIGGTLDGNDALDRNEPQLQEEPNEPEEHD